METQPKLTPAQRKQKKIDAMIKSLHTFPSYARKEMGTDGKAGLSNCCYTTKKCGCEIEGNGTLQNPLNIKYCKKHKKAIDMHDELVDMIETIKEYHGNILLPVIKISLNNLHKKGNLNNK